MLMNYNDENKQTQPEEEPEVNPVSAEDDVSMYYPDGDAANMEKDDLEEEYVSQGTRKKRKVKKKNSQLTKSQIALIAIVFVIYTLVIFAAAWLIFYRPTGAHGEEIPFDTSVETDAEKGVQPPLDNNPENPTQPDESDLSDTTDSEYTAKSEVYNFLLVGHDAEATLADVTMIVNYDVANNSIAVMQIPRDTLVTTGVATNKVNAAFSAYYHQAWNEGAKDPYVTAMQNYAEMFEKSLCIKIHHTVLMNLNGFQNIVDILDGVDVDVPVAMQYSDPEQNLYIDIPKGWQHLDGYNAMCFVRFRSGYVQADLGRVNAQKIFLTALFNKAKSTVKSLNVSAMTKLANEVFDNLHTDLTASDFVYYITKIANINLDAIEMMTMPGNIADTYYVMNRAGTLEAVNTYFNIYDKEITDAIFDHNCTFCYTNLNYLSEVYYAPADSTLDGVYNADSINTESIYIP